VGVREISARGGDGLFVQNAALMIFYHGRMGTARGRGAKKTASHYPEIHQAWDGKEEAKIECGRICGIPRTQNGKVNGFENKRLARRCGLWHIEQKAGEPQI